jgi:lactate dehydrogenase-like 2-hydroxyacid dehydrogenase
VTRVALTRRFPESVETALCERYDVRLPGQSGAMDAQALREACYWADVVCPTVTDDLGGGFVQSLDPARLRCRLFANFGVGYNHIDVSAARALGIAVSNTPDVLTDATADLALLLMLMVARRAGEGERWLRAGHWGGWQPKQLMGREVSGAQLGIVGMGRIGQAVARRARGGFGMQVSCFSRSPLPAELAAELDVRAAPSLDALIAGNNFVSLHCPSTPETRHLIDAERLAQFSPDAYLINTARGDIVDEAALGQALAAGTLAGAGLDVYEREPVVHESLLGLENVVLLPHLGSATAQTRAAMGWRVAANVAAHLAGEPLPDPVW